MSDGITDEARRDRIFQRRTEQRHKMLGEDAHRALSNMTKKKLFPMLQTFRKVCLEDIVPDTKDDLVIIDEDDARLERMMNRKMDALSKKLGPNQHFGGLITDPIPGRLRKLEERVSKIESQLRKDKSWMK